MLRSPPSIRRPNTGANEVSVDRSRGNSRGCDPATFSTTDGTNLTAQDRPSIHTDIPPCVCVCVCVSDDNTHPFRLLLVMQVNVSSCLKAVTCQDSIVRFQMCLCACSFKPGSQSRYFITSSALRDNLLSVVRLSVAIWKNDL